jgi:hypothetical protein
MKTLKLLSFLTYFIAAFAWAQNTQVAPFDVTGLQNYAGKNLSVYFVSGRQATIGTSGQEVHVNKVMSGPHIYSIPRNGIVALDGVAVPRDGWTSYNFAIFVVHEQPVHALTNLAWVRGAFVREPVRYHDDSFTVDYSEATQRYLLKDFRTSRQVGQGQEIRL